MAALCPVCGPGFRRDRGVSGAGPAQPSAPLPKTVSEPAPAVCIEPRDVVVEIVPVERGQASLEQRAGLSVIGPGAPAPAQRGCDERGAWDPGLLEIVGHRGVVGADLAGG